MEYRIIATAVIEKNGKFLLGRKPKNVGPYPNTWHCPGGGINLEKETVMEALKREIKEETGIGIKDIEQLGFGEDYEPNKNGVMTHYIFLVFKVRYSSGKLKPGDDIARARWFDKSALKRIALARPAEKLFKKIGLI